MGTSKKIKNRFRKFAGNGGLVLTLFILGLVLKPFQTLAEEENRPERIHLKNGQTVITLTEEELTLNEIQVEKPESAQVQKKHNLRGWLIPEKEIGFYLAPEASTREPEADFVYIEAEGSANNPSEIRKVFVNLNDQKFLETQPVKLGSAPSQLKKVYRISKKFLEHPLPDEVTLTALEGKSEKAMRIPESAVVWTEGKPFVYMMKSAGIFLRKEIRLRDSITAAGKVDTDCLWIQEDKNLEKGIVSQGAQQLLSEELIADIGEEAE